MASLIHPTRLSSRPFESLVAHLPLVAKALALIPADLHASAWVAGSAANPSLRRIAWEAGGDLDVFVCNMTAERRTEVREVLRNATTLYRPLADVIEGLDTYPVGGLFDVAYSQDRLQIMLTASSITDTLARFDLSCHAWAFPLYAQTHPIHDPRATRWGVEVLSWTRPHATVYRALKMALRYEGHDGLRGMWLQERFLQCVREASGMQLVRGEDLEHVKALLVQEGL